MRKVIGIGETVLDIIFRDEQPISAVPGGSTFNAMVSLGRSGVKCSMISETGNDRIGHNIIGFLEKNGVDASNINVYPESKSPLSLAFLNEQNDAEYIFYKDHPNDRIDYIYPDIQPDDIVLYGSYFALNPVIRSQVYAFLDYARQHGAILYYDVNFRASHQNEVMKITLTYWRTWRWQILSEGRQKTLTSCLRKMTPTRCIAPRYRSTPINLFIPVPHNLQEVRAENGFSKQYPVLATKTVSTIGAGDNFNAGFIFGLIKNGITHQEIDNGLTEAQWDCVIKSALEFSAECCRSISNHVSVEFGAQKKKELEEALSTIEE